MPAPGRGRGLRALPASVCRFWSAWRSASARKTAGSRSTRSSTRGGRSRPISAASSVLVMRSMRWRSACASRSCCWARSRLAASMSPDRSMIERSAAFPWRSNSPSALARASRSSASWSCCWPFLLRSPVRRSMALAVGPRWRVGSASRPRSAWLRWSTCTAWPASRSRSFCSVANRSRHCLTSSFPVFWSSSSRVFSPRPSGPRRRVVSKICAWWLRLSPSLPGA